MQTAQPPEPKAFDVLKAKGEFGGDYYSLTPDHADFIDEAASKQAAVRPTKITLAELWGPCKTSSRRRSRCTRARSYRRDQTRTKSTASTAIQY